MRRRILPKRSTVTIVQQTNYVTTKQLVSDFFLGKSVDMNPGNTARSFDFPDGEVDFDKPLLTGFENLIDQSVHSNKITDFFNPPSPVPSDPPSPVSSDPAPPTPAE